MKKLLKKILFLMIIIFLPLVSINIIAYFMTKESSFNLPPNIHILILGDSHTEYAINDKIIENSINISNSAEAYLYSYIKLLKFVEKNPQIDTVLLSFHFKSLTKEIDRWVLGPEYLLAKMPPYLPFISKREWKVAILPNLLPFLQNTTKQNLKFIIKNSLNNEITFRNLNLGCYKESYRKKLNDDVKRKEKSKEACLGISKLQIEYLTKIIDICKNRDISLVLISTPIFKAQKFYNTKKMYDYYQKNLKGIEFIDCSNEEIPENGFSDISHLSAYGSDIFSRKLQVVLEKKR